MDIKWNIDFGMKKDKSIFKCRDCGEKYEDSFCSTHDVSLCRRCSGEEKD